MLDPLILQIRNEQMKFDRHYLEEHLREWQANQAALRLLDASGVNSRNQWGAGKPNSGYAHDMNVRFGYEGRVTADDLPKLRAAFGVCKDAGAYEIENGKERLVKVALDLGCGPDCKVKLHYVRPLPDDSPCRIVEEVRDLPATTITNHKLVCGVAGGAA